MNILVFFAHPDDETMLCGGLLALLSKSGHTTHFLSSTRGEGGERGDPPLCLQKDLGSLREKELFCAVKALGGRTLNFLDYIDPIVGADNTLFPFTDVMSLLISQLVEQIKRTKIDVLITHGSNGEYGHPGHRIIYQATKELVNRYYPKLTWYTVQAFYENSSKPYILNKDDPADWIIDVTSVLEMKINAALCHLSQHALFVRRKSNELGKQVGVPEIIPTHESYHLANGKKDLLMEIPILRSNLVRLHDIS
ncbi:MAG: PIG-L deacetylase family protein [Anaerolineaceae bacterium]|nr:PIG-L deacetylase family protein [Anaerolineaceae bacterium]